MFRIGIGTDTHRLVEGRPLILGGVNITSDLGAEGHSDADALSHAIADAILGALCEGDLGVHFPDRDPNWSGADSLELLSSVMWLARERNLSVVNVDSTIMLEAPRLRVLRRRNATKHRRRARGGSDVCQCEGQNRRRSRRCGPGTSSFRAGRCLNAEQLRKQLETSRRH